MTYNANNMNGFADTATISVIIYKMQEIH